MSEREVIRCPSCRLNQFMTHSGLCRRCQVPFAESPEILAVPIPPRCHIDLYGVFIKNLRAELDLRGWSHRILAVKAETSRTWISKLENRHASPTLDSIQRLADAFGIPAYTLLIPLESK